MTVNLNRAVLAQKCWDQEEFARSYSPLYAALFTILGRWCEQDNHPVIDWLMAVGANRTPFDLILVLLAGVHRELLLGEPATAVLAPYYPTVGGTLPPTDPQLADHFQTAILASQTRLIPFIQKATVQTNETGRGLAWLLPLLGTGWEATHLGDLGASAGLNLVADARAFHMVESVSGNGRYLGQGLPPQFTTLCHNQADIFSTRHPLPKIVSRIGGDIAPFHLDTPFQEQTLASYIWGDQTHRLDRLREGIAALRQAQPPVTLHPLHLPDGLTAFLQNHLPSNPTCPITLYNTYITVYLSDKGTSLRTQIGDWAKPLNQPVLWLQWEPDYGRSPYGPPPDVGWCAWTADLWHNGDHHHWQIAWIHPHGTQLYWTSAWAEWQAFWQNNG